MRKESDGVSRLWRGALAVAILTVSLGAFAATASQPFKHLKLRNLGPAVSGGRVTAVLGIPGKPNVYYVGAAAGGLWKTTDGGDSWTDIFKHGDSASIGAVAIAPSNHSDIWVGTGEANPRNDITNGHGVYFSPDGGKTWKFMGLKDAGMIHKIIVDPKNPDVVYVAALGNPWKPNKERGVYMTTDGGQHWHKTLYVNDKTGAVSLVMDPGNPNVLFAGMWETRRFPWDYINGGPYGGIWRSTDGGRTWNKLTNGLPKGNIGRIQLAIARSNPDHVYALIDADHGRLWGSTDLGKHWHKISDNHALSVRPFYFSVLAVSPDNQNKLYFGSFNLLESTNGGKTAHVIDKNVHVDHHAIWIDPKNPNRIIQGNDGGAFATMNGGKTWRHFDNIPIEQFYTVSIGHTHPFEVCGGLQDNDSACGPSNSLDYGGISGDYWWSPAGGDGVYSVPAPSDPNIIYADSEDGFIMRVNAKTKVSRMIRPILVGVNNEPESKLPLRFNWASPIAVSPDNPNEVYLGADKLLRSTDGGTHWKAISPDLTRNDKSKQKIAGGPVNHDISGAENYDTILSISIASSNPKVIWVGTDDGRVWVTQDGGKHWHNVTPNGAPKWGRVSQIGISPFNDGTAYLTFDNHMLGDNTPYVYKLTDFGAHSKRISNNLPKGYSAFVVREDPNRRGLLALGTAKGLYVSFDDGSHWNRLKANLPTVPVWDLKFVKQPHDLVLATHGRGLWILDNIESLEGWSNRVAADDLHIFAPSEGVQWIRYYGTHIGPGPSAFVAPNPPYGSVISYYLKSKIKGAKDGKGPVKITIMDDMGHTVDVLHGSGHPGINEVTWNTHYKMPTKLKNVKMFGGFGAGPAGPFALPGAYKVRIAAGKNAAETKVHVVEDPRVHVPMAKRRQILQQGLELRNEMSALNTVLNHVNAWQKTLRDVLEQTAHATAGSQNAKVHKQAEALNEKIKKYKEPLWNSAKQHNVPEDGLHYLTRFHAWLGSVYGMFAGNLQQLPNSRQQAEINKTASRLKHYLTEFNGSLLPAVKNFDEQAYGAGVQTLAQPHPVSIKPVQMP